MGFLDNIKDLLQGKNNDHQYYDDDQYDEYYDEDGEYPEPMPEEPSRGGLLGNSRRPEAESVSVYTRSGRPLNKGPFASASESYRGGSVASPKNIELGSTRGYAAPTRSFDEDTDSFDTSQDFHASGIRPLGDQKNRIIPRSSSAQLPPYVLRPVAYDDVQLLVRRVHTNQPVVLVFSNTNVETAKRILDFSYGFAIGFGGQVQELGDRVFVVLPNDKGLSDADIDKLVADGDLKR